MELKRSSENSDLFELHPKSWTSPLQLTRCGFFMTKYTLHFKYQAVLHYLHIRSRRSLRHLPNPPATMDTRLSRRRHRRTRTSPIQNHDRTPQKPLHRRQTRPRKNTGRTYRRVVLYARRGRLHKGVKSPRIRTKVCCTVRRGIGNCWRNIPWFKACRVRRTVGTMRRWKASLRC